MEDYEHVLNSKRTDQDTRPEAQWLLLRQMIKALRSTRMLVFNPKVVVAGIYPSRPDHLHRAMESKET